jgi:hypothetical protein
MNVVLWATQQRAREPARHAIPDDEVLDLEQRSAVRARTTHAASDSAKWQALTWAAPMVRSSGRSSTQRP